MIWIVVAMLMLLPLLVAVVAALYNYCNDPREISAHDVVEAALAGNTVRAIRYYKRLRGGGSTKDAKRAIDLIRRGRQ